MKTINLRYAFKYMDSPKDVIKKNSEKKIRALGRLEGSSMEELKDLSCYNHNILILKGGLK